MLNTRKCLVCRQQLPTAKMLKSHYMAAHSKLQLIRALLKNSLFRNSNCVFTHNSIKKRSLQDVSFGGVSPKYLKTEILYLEDTFQNFDWDDDISENYPTSDNSPDESPKRKCNITHSLLEDTSFIFSNEVAFSPSYKIVPKIEQNTGETSFSGNYESQDVEDKAAIKNTLLNMEKVMRERKQKLKDLRNFRFKKQGKTISTKLNESTGNFYVCHCTESQKNNITVPIYQKSDLQNLLSDTESCSDTGRSYCTSAVDCKLYCYTCGNGYASKRKLLDHFKTHETKCGICETTFRSAESYKLHLKKHLLKIFVCHLCEAEFSHKDMLLDHLDAHIEDDIYENVFRLEQDYKVENRPNQLYYLDYMFGSRYYF